MKICVYGAGAVGGHLAAKLSASGEDVSIIARGPHLQAIREKGVTLLHGSQTIVGRVRGSDRPADLGVQDFVFVTLKANMLAAFAESAAPLLGAQTAVIFVQNGIPWWYGKDLPRLDPGGKLARTIAAERVIGGVVYSANEVVEPGVIRNMVPGSNMLVVGEMDNRNSPRIEALRAVLEKSDVSSPAAQDIRQAIWGKLLQNLGTSSVCTLTGTTVSVVRSDPGLMQLGARVRAEGDAIARAHGVDPGRAPSRPGGGQSSGLSGHKPSMLQDYERGRPMEVESQLMAPLAMARAAKVEASVLETLATLVAHKAAAKGLYDP